MTIEQIQDRLDALYWEFECDHEHAERIQDEIDALEREMIDMFKEVDRAKSQAQVS